MVAASHSLQPGQAPIASGIPIRRIGADDVRAALREGYADFRSKRGDLIFIGFIYPVVGLVVAVAALGYSVLPLLFPIAAGISLLGPLVATGFYELARRREAGLESSWWHFFDIRKSRSADQIYMVGGLLIAIFLAWLAAAGFLYVALMGAVPPHTLGALLTGLFTTPQGWAVMLIGDLVGLGFAIAVLAVSLISLPMLVDSDVDAGTAIVTSLRVVRANPGTATRWGLTVAVLLVLGSIPFFLGLAVVLPVLGYATWHLYTRAVDRSGLPVNT